MESEGLLLCAQKTAICP